MTGTDLSVALRRSRNSMPETSPPKVDVESHAECLFEIAVIYERRSRRKQQAGIAELPQQSRHAPQHCRVVVDHKDDISILQSISLGLSVRQFQ
jgi:hypothetical protein